MGTTLDSPLHCVNSMRILALTGLHFLPTFTRSLSARQVFGAVAEEKFSVDIDNRAIDCTLDQFYFSKFFSLINYYYYYYYPLF